MGVGAELAAKGWVCHSNVLSPPPHVRKGPMSKEPAPGLSCKPLVHDTALPPPSCAQAGQITGQDTLTTAGPWGEIRLHLNLRGYRGYPIQNCPEVVS